MPHRYLSQYALDDVGRTELRCKEHPDEKLGIFEADDHTGANEAFWAHMRAEHAADVARMEQHVGAVAIETEILNDPMPTEPTHLDTVDYLRAACAGIGCGWQSPNRYRDDDEGREKARAEAAAHTG